MNKPSQQELWKKIQNFSLDDSASSFPFSKKLAKENNWPLQFAGKAIEEYKKFIFLSCISPTGASPSEIVDSVWHLHLTYTDNYWNQFCKQTLNKEIHHHPSKGGNTEKEKHNNWYEETLKLYEDVFGNKPPSNIWPVYEKGKDDINEFIYAPAFFKRIVAGFLITILFYITAVNLFHTKGKDFLIHYLVVCGAGIIILFITQSHKDGRLKLILGKILPLNVTVFQMSRFLYGSHRCYQTALVDLLKRDIIEVNGSGYKIVQRKEYDWDKEENPLLQPLMQNLTGETFSYSEGLGLIDKETVLHPDIERLYRLSKKIDYQKLIIPGVVLLVGFARFLQGVSNDKPVGLLVFEMLLFSMLCLMILQSFSYTRTVRLQLSGYWLEENEKGYGNNILNNFAILGTPAIAGFAEYIVLNNVFNMASPVKGKWTGSDPAGCSSSGGSSCGSSCSGGCGGCGGGT